MPQSKKGWSPGRGRPGYTGTRWRPTNVVVRVLYADPYLREGRPGVIVAQHTNRKNPGDRWVTLEHIEPKNGRYKIFRVDVDRLVNVAGHWVPAYMEVDPEVNPVPLYEPWFLRGHARGESPVDELVVLLSSLDPLLRAEGYIRVAAWLGWRALDPDPIFLPYEVLRRRWPEVFR